MRDEVQRDIMEKDAVRQEEKREELRAHEQLRVAAVSEYKKEQEIQEQERNERQGEIEKAQKEAVEGYINERREKARNWGIVDLLSATHSDPAPASADPDSVIVHRDKSISRSRPWMGVSHVCNFQFGVRGTNVQPVYIRGSGKAS
jgi:hypothetical protein